MISLISNRAIFFDIKDIKECHKNLTDCRLPTINSLEYAEKRRQARASAHFGANGKEGQPRKRAEKGRACEPLTTHTNSFITQRGNF